jgi:hypothetical protein
MSPMGSTALQVACVVVVRSNREEPFMSDASRRGFLFLAGTGAAVVGAAAVAPAAVAARPPEDYEAVAGDGPLVAYIRDINKGEVSVMRGEREVVVHDRALCASLARVLS